MKLPRVPAFATSDLFFFHDPDSAPRPVWWRTVSFIAVALVVLGPLLASDSLAPPTGLTWSDQHRNASLEIAVSRVLCGTESRRSPAFPVAEHLEAYPELRDVPLRDIAAKLAGSLSDYCRSAVQPFLNAENSLMLEMTLFLGVQPQLSLRELGWCLQASRIVALLLFGYVLLENGASLLFAGAVLFLGFGTLVYLGPTSYYSLYPFLPVLLMLVVAFLSFCAQRRLSNGCRLLAAAAIAGWLSAFAVNMRSSHLPVYLALLALFFLCRGRPGERKHQRGWHKSQLGWLAGGILSAGIGYGLFSAVFIQPLMKDGAGGQASPHHPVAHAVVLSLAVPENALSRREGIAWDDSVGLTLARRIDPQASYLREGYEPALFAYYWRLWVRYPSEMVGIYWAKLQIAGRSMISKLLVSPAGPVAWPLAWVPNGAVFLALQAVLFSLCLGVHLRTASPLAFTMTLLAAAGLLLQLETALIIPTFDATHHSTQLFCFVTFAALVWQLPVEIFGLVARAVWRRHRARRDQA